MGFKRTDSGSNRPVAPAFLNVEVLFEDGKTAQVGGIPLSLQKQLHAALIEQGEEGASKLTFKVSLKLVEERTADSYKFAVNA